LAIGQQVTHVHLSETVAGGAGGVAGEAVSGDAGALAGKGTRGVGDVTDFLCSLPVRLCRAAQMFHGPLEFRVTEKKGTGMGIWGDGGDGLFRGHAGRTT
jgi:hypothetical protein